MRNQLRVMLEPAVLLRAAIAALLLGLPLGAQSPKPQLPPGGKTLVTAADLTYKGFWRLPDTDGTGYTTASIGVRYVEGDRRFLIADFTNKAPSGRLWADLVEWRCPSHELAMGGDPSAAPACTEARRWKQDWTVHDATPAWHDAASSVRLGAILWDETLGGVWYTAFGYYSSKNMPFLGFTRLLDEGRTQKFGPWWYRENDPNDQSLYVKQVSQGLLAVPEGSQEALDGRRHVAFANPGSLASQGHLGIGLHALHLPPLSTPANREIPLGLRLADYSPDSPARPQHARRDRDYTPITFPGHSVADTGLQPGGYWQMNLDQVNGCAWVDGATREGVLCFGRQVSGKVAYGWNPLSSTPGWTRGTPDFVDPTRAVGDGNGYKGEFWKGAIYRFDPKELREVADGRRAPWNTGINPQNIGDWKALWPGMPSSTGRHMDVHIGSSLVWDDRAKELIWCNPTTAGAQPTCHVWAVP